MRYAEFLERDHFDYEELLGLSQGNLVEDPPEEFIRLPAPPMLMPATQRRSASAQEGSAPAASINEETALAGSCAREASPRSSSGPTTTNFAWHSCSPAHVFHFFFFEHWKRTVFAPPCRKNRAGQVVRPEKSSGEWTKTGRPL